jgi:N-acylneuraminate cytidylyltransferase
MISYAVRAASESDLFDQIIVSTDDEEIASISKQFGASVPFLRPSELADDHTPTVPVIQHAIEFLASIGSSPEYICCIYPCVPFLQASDLHESFKLLTQSDRQFCFPIIEHPSPIQRALRMDNKGALAPIFNDFQLERTQDLERAFYDAGQFYWGSMDAWLSSPRIYENATGYEVKHWKAIDIDTPSDWDSAETLFKTILPD